MSKLFIGMPIYNGARFLERSIESIRSQSFSDWQMLISDNASTDETATIATRFATLDKRIHYVRQEQNIGGEKNFGYLLGKADAPFFMWASDDLWEKDFIETIIRKLESDHEYGLGFCNIVNIDADDNVIREYPSFTRFCAPTLWEQTVQFVLDGEKLGKANFLYSIFRTNVAKAAWSKSPFSETVGAEACFALAAISSSKLAILDKVLFKKRLLASEGGKGLGSPWQDPEQYIKETLQAVENTGFERAVQSIMLLRKELHENTVALGRKGRLIALLKKPHTIPGKVLKKIWG